MAFGNKGPAARVGADRLAGLAGAGALASAPGAATGGGASPAPARRLNLEPDVSRMRPMSFDASPEARKQRLRAKAINFTATILARVIILAAGGVYLWKTHQFSGQVSRGLAVGMFAMSGDLGRVILKAMEPGTK